MAFNQAKADEICEQIASGKSLRQVGEIVGIAAQRICELQDNPAFAGQYTRAMEARADFHASRIESLADDVEAGIIDPNAARVAIDARKWTASKLRPKRYGDRVQHDGDMTLNIKIHDPAKLLRDK